MKIYIYPQPDNLDGTNPKDRLYDDPKRYKFALYQGKAGSTDVYEVLPQNREAFEALAHAHGCTEIYL